MYRAMELPEEGFVDTGDSELRLILSSSEQQNNSQQYQYTYVKKQNTKLQTYN